MPERTIPRIAIAGGAARHSLFLHPNRGRGGVACSAFVSHVGQIFHKNLLEHHPSGPSPIGDSLWRDVGCSQRLPDCESWLVATLVFPGRLSAALPNLLVWKVVSGPSGSSCLAHLTSPC